MLNIIPPAARKGVLLALGIACFGTVALGAALLSHSTTSPSPPSEQTMLLNLDRVPEEVVLRDNEWRLARHVEPGRHVLELGSAKPGDAVRFSVTLRRMASTLPQFEVYVGESKVKTFRLTTAGSWEDHRVVVPASAHEGAACRIYVDSAASLWISACELVRNEPRTPNVLVFLIDTLRPDHLGAYGYHRKTSPAIDSLAADGITFTQAVSQSSWTRPAVASLLTSTYPAVHGAKDRADVLRGDLPTIAEAFRAVGYETVGLMSNPSCLPTWGFGRGFSRYIDVDSAVVEADKDARVVGEALDVLHNVSGRPWFLYCHAIGPHSPYEPPAPYDRRFVSRASEGQGPEAELARVVDLYDGEIGFTDHQLKRIIEELKSTGQYDNTLIVVVSDHGEAFGEHGDMGHGSSLYDEQIRVPLVVKLPGGKHAGTVHDGLVELVDVAPTLLDTLKIAVPDRFQGVSLAKAMTGHASIGDEDRIGYASLFLEKKSVYAARTAALKYVDDVAENRTLWFDLARDPRETRPLPQEPSGGERLVRYTSKIISSGDSGLCILVTGSLLDHHVITGTVSGDELGPHELRYPANNGEVTRTQGGLNFRIVTSPGPEAPADLVEWHETGAEQNSARLRIAIPPSAPFTLTLELDGKPMPPDYVFCGADKISRRLDASPFLPTDIAADPKGFFPDALPRRLAVYVWYVTLNETIPDSDLEPRMADALKALGYL